MLKNFFLLLTLMVLSASYAHSAPITDVSEGDDSYPAIKKIVDYGYMPLLKGNQFFPDKSLSRKEFAVTLDKVIKKIDNQDLTLTKSDLQELQNLSRSFKTFLVDNDANISTLKNKTQELDNAQKVNSQDLTQVNDQLRGELNALKSDNEHTHLYMILGGVALAFLAMLVK